MHELLTIRPLAPDDLAAYKTLRNASLAAHPEAFSSDAEAERDKPAHGYLARIEAPHDEGGHFTLGAWRGGRLVGAITCERDMRVKVRHIGHIAGMMVDRTARRSGTGRALLEACIALARNARGLELLTLNVSEGNDAALRLYESAGFTRYGMLPRALKVAGRYVAKVHMFLAL